MSNLQDKANHQQCSALLTKVTIIMHIIQTYNTVVCYATLLVKEWMAHQTLV